MRSFLFAALLLVSNAACRIDAAAPPAGAPPVSAPTDVAAADSTLPSLLGVWQHHYELDEDGRQMWTKESRLPPSMFRPRMSIEPDGRAQVLVLHPADAHYMAEGRWTLEGDRLTVEHRPEGGEWVVERFEILSSDDEKLVLRRAPR